MAEVRNGVGNISEKLSGLAFASFLAADRAGDLQSEGFLAARYDSVLKCFPKQGMDKLVALGMGAIHFSGGNVPIMIERSFQTLFSDATQLASHVAGLAQVEVDKGTMSSALLPQLLA